MTSKDKVCRECRSFVKGDACPVCNGDDLTTTWAGVAVIVDPKHSKVAEKMGVEVAGKFALKVR